MIWKTWKSSLLRPLCLVMIVCATGASQAQESPSIESTPAPVSVSPAGHLPANADNPSSLEKNEHEIRALFSLAKKYSADNDFRKSLFVYEKMYKQFGKPWLLINIGRMHHKMENLRLALDYYYQYLSLPATSQHPDLTSQALKFAAQAELGLARSGLSAALQRPDLVGELPEASQSRRRPRWRIVLGVSLSVLATASLALGVPGIVLDGQCASNTWPGLACDRKYSSLPQGVSLSIGGALGMSGGILLAFLPASGSSREAQKIRQGSRLSSASPIEPVTSLTRIDSYALLP